MYVADCYKVYQAALNAGGTLMMKITTMEHAEERYGNVKEFACNIRWIASHVEDITLEESQQRIKKLTNNSTHMMPADNRRFGNMAGRRIYAQLLFAIRLKFQPTNNAEL